MTKYLKRQVTCTFLRWLSVNLNKRHPAIVVADIYCNGCVITRLQLIFSQKFSKLHKNPYGSLMHHGTTIEYQNKYTYVMWYGDASLYIVALRERHCKYSQNCNYFTKFLLHKKFFLYKMISKLYTSRRKLLCKKSEPAMTNVELDIFKRKFLFI